MNLLEAMNVDRPGHLALTLSLLFPWLLVVGPLVARVGGAFRVVGWSIIALGAAMLVLAGIYDWVARRADSGSQGDRRSLREALEDEGMSEPILSILLVIQRAQAIAAFLVLALFFGFGPAKASSIDVLSFGTTRGP